MDIKPQTIKSRIHARKRIAQMHLECLSCLSVNITPHVNSCPGLQRQESQTANAMFIKWASHTADFALMWVRKLYPTNQSRLFFLLIGST